MTETHTPDKSTTVRTTNSSSGGRDRRRDRSGWTSRAPQAAIRTLLRLVPPLVPTLGAQLFMRPPTRSIAGRRVPGTRLSIQLDGQPLVVWRRSRPGDRGTVLLVHGWGGDASDMAPLSDALAQRGFSTILFDAPAHGASGGRLSSLVAFSRAIHSVLEVFGPVAAIAAHSLGGAATALALSDTAAPPAGAAILIASPTHPGEWLSRLSRTLGLGADSRLRLQREIETKVGVSFGQLDLETRAHRIRIPTLVVHDRDDRVVPPEAGAILCRALPRSRALWTEGLGHRRILSDEGILGLVADFVGEHVALPTRAAATGLRDPQMAAFTDAIDQSLEGLMVA